MFIISVAVTSTQIHAQESVVFSGKPSVMFSNQFGTGGTVNLDSNQAEQYKCVIKKIDDKYYWS